ncbi:MAG: hypothetical protein FJ215_03125 [Ignavibacteria bacterium]|nr:hypothetical protein [Ignavibacteria bacterium]
MHLRSFCLMFLPLAFLASGCLQVHTVVKVNTDGSGTIEETVTYGKSIAILKEVFDEKEDEWSEVRDRSRSYGEGVTFVSSSRIRSRDSRGHRAIFAFTDINTVRLNQNPDRVVSTGSKKTRSEGPKMKDEYVTFRFSKGQPSRLTILMPQEKRAEVSVKKERKSRSRDDEGLDLARWLVGDLELSTTVEVEGRVMESNASFRKGSVITLFAINLDDLLDSEGFLQEASEYEEISLSDAKRLMKKYPGIKVELNREVSVSFRK